MTLTSRSFTGLMALLAGVLAWAAPAAAQFGMGMDFGAMAGMNRVRRSEIRTFAAILKLDEEQTKAAEGLYDGYSHASRGLSSELESKMRAAQEKVQDTGDFRSIGVEMARVGKDFNEKSRTLEKGLMDDLRALLTPDQDAQWVRVERARRRSAGMRMGIVAGHNVDLLDIVSDIGADRDPSPDLTDTLGRYEMEIDRGVQAFKKIEEDQEQQADNLDEMFDPAKMQEMMQKGLATLKEASQIAKGMRDVNRQYARLIVPLLPEQHRARFDEEFKRRSFPRVYRAPYVVKALDSAAKFDDLTPDQRTALNEIREGYSRDAAGANNRWAEAIDARDEKTGGPLLAMMSGVMGGGAAAGTDVSEASTARRELDDRYKDRLRTALTQEQRDRLPEEVRDQREDFDFMGMALPEDDEEEPPAGH